MVKERQYNGYPNYETWTVSLWMDNDRSSCDHYRALAQAVSEQKRVANTDHLTKSQADAVLLAQLLKDDFTDASPLSDAVTVYSDLLDAALSEVDWCWIARSLVEETEERKQ